MDFNLYGMGFVRLGKVLFRGALPTTPLLPPRGWLHRTELHHPGQSGPGLSPAPMSISSARRATHKHVATPCACQKSYAHNTAHRRGIYWP